MKKQIIFYIGWDVLFIVFLYLYYYIGSWAEEYYYRAVHVYPYILAMAILPIMVGGFISWLVFASSRYQLTKKSAALELAIVGGPAFYLITAVFITPFAAYITGGNIPQFAPAWLFFSITPMTIVSILFGYELFIFIVRIFKLKQLKNPSEV